MRNDIERIPDARGFSLAEMAIVVLILSIAMTMGLKMMTANLDNSAYSETRAKQERIKVALIGFLRSNGQLPCPDSTGGVATGVAPATCTAPGTGYGVVPWQTLGLPRDAVVDGWGNFFTYRVANFISATQITTGPLAPPLHKNANQNWTAKANFDIRSLSDATALPGYQSLVVNTRDNTGTVSPESRTAIVVILSHGKNGFGAKTVKNGGRIPNAGAGADEVTNATNNSATFIRRPLTDTTTNGGPYDDVVTYLTPQHLLQPLIDEKTLRGACQAYCTPPPSPTPPPATCTTDQPIPVGNFPINNCP